MVPRRCRTALRACTSADPTRRHPPQEAQRAKEEAEALEMMMNVKCLDTGTTHSAEDLNEKARHSATKLSVGPRTYLRARRTHVRTSACAHPRPRLRPTCHARLTTTNHARDHAHDHNLQEAEEEAAMLEMMMNVKCLDTGTVHNAENLNEKAHTFSNTPPSSPPSNNPFQKMKPKPSLGRRSVSFSNDAHSGSDNDSIVEDTSSEEEEGGSGRGGRGAGGGGTSSGGSTFAGNPFQKMSPAASKKPGRSNNDSDSDGDSDGSEEEDSDEANDPSFSRRGSLLGRLETGSKAKGQSPSPAKPAPSGGGGGGFSGNPFKKNPPPPKVEQGENSDSDSDSDSQSDESDEKAQVVVRESEEKEQVVVEETKSPAVKPQEEKASGRGWSNPFRKKTSAPAPAPAPAPGNDGGSDSDESVDEEIKVSAEPTRKHR